MITCHNQLRATCLADRVLSGAGESWAAKGGQDRDGEEGELHIVDVCVLKLGWADGERSVSFVCLCCQSTLLSTDIDKLSGR